MTKLTKSTLQPFQKAKYSPPINDAGQSDKLASKARERLVKKGK